ncbi:MAG: hypothetical protein J6Y02_24945 [Pseudobutyrivibrio sp.]|nr:hypothetical protein [Pseudobutyrivibrio sp.]
MNLLLLYFILGIACGIVIGMFLWGFVLARRWLAGTLRYHEIDGESQPYLSLDLDKYPEEIKTRKYILFRVKVHSLDIPKTEFKKPPQK